MRRGDLASSRWAARASIVGLLAVLCFLAGFSVVTQRGAAGLSRRTDDANRVSEIYQSTRFSVGQEESLERKYRLEPGPAVSALHEQAERNLVRDLQALLLADPSAPNRAVVARLLDLNSSYVRASEAMFRAVDARQPALVIHFDHSVVDPVSGAMQDIVYGNARVASARALAINATLRRNQDTATRAIAIVFALGVALLSVFGLIIARFRRRHENARLAELSDLAEIAVTDPLTGLRNHRAFHEDLARSLHRVGRTNVPLTLVMLDLDGLKEVNDRLGHQTGDEHLKALADAIRATVRGSDCGYRVGGDEFAVILDNTRAWNALEFFHRLRPR